MPYFGSTLVFDSTRSMLTSLYLVDTKDNHLNAIPFTRSERTRATPQTLTIATSRLFFSTSSGLAYCDLGGYFTAQSAGEAPEGAAALIGFKVYLRAVQICD